MNTLIILFTGREISSRAKGKKVIRVTILRDTTTLTIQNTLEEKITELTKICSYELFNITGKEPNLVKESADNDELYSNCNIFDISNVDPGFDYQVNVYFGENDKYYGYNQIEKGSFYETKYLKY